MELKQKLELRRLLVPELNQSLKILALALPDLRELIESELEANPLLEELPAKTIDIEPGSLPPWPIKTGISQDEMDYRLSILTKVPSLQDSLLRQLGMFASTDLELKIGQEIIGNIDENGYLKATLDEISATCGTTPEEAEKVLKEIQRFEPPGTGARNAAECLLLQMELLAEDDPLMEKIITDHLDDVARKNYSQIAKTLQEPLEKVEIAIKKIQKLNPKPGLNYASETIQHVIPDITINEIDEDELEIEINNEDIPIVNISRSYRKMMKDASIDQKARAFLTEKLKSAMALLRALSKRKFTLRRITEAVAEIQKEAILTDLSHLKPLNFAEVAQRLNIHETTVCRAIMNKYVKLPYGIVPLKAFFPSKLQDQDGQSVSSEHVKGLISGLIQKENHKKPLSDQDIADYLNKEKNMGISRRTVAKYREELKILNSSFRRER